MPTRKVKITGDTEATIERRSEDLGEEAHASRKRLPIERVIQIPVIKVYPDPHQPRTPILPSGEAGKFIRERFIAGEIDCFQAAKEWMKHAEGDLGHSKRVGFLLDMAAGIDSEDGGQINPVTVVPMTEPQGAFMIETGEQRFWAVILRYVSLGMKGDPPVLKVVQKEEFSQKRQVLENRHVGPPTVVSQAREIATLFISEGFLEVPEELAGVHPAELDPFAIHRWVAAERKPHKSWEALEEIMSMSVRRMQQTLAILQMPTALLLLSDRFELPERVLREVISQPEESWPELIDLAIHDGWTSEDIDAVELKGTDPKGKPQKKLRPPHQQAHSAISRFVRTLSRTTEDPSFVIGQVATEVAGSKESVDTYHYLSTLTAQVRLRLLEMGLLEDD
jgi:hypothetical protein